MFFLKIHGWLHPIPRLSAVIIICIPRLPAVIVICTEAGSVSFPTCQQWLSFVPRLDPSHSPPASSGCHLYRGWLRPIPRLPAVIVICIARLPAVIVICTAAGSIWPRLAPSHSPPASSGSGQLSWGGQSDWLTSEPDVLCSIRLCQSNACLPTNLYITLLLDASGSWRDLTLRRDTADRPTEDQKRTVRGSHVHPHRLQ